MSQEFEMNLGLLLGILFCLLHVVACTNEEPSSRQSFVYFSALTVVQKGQGKWLMSLKERYSAEQMRAVIKLPKSLAASDETHVDMEAPVTLFHDSSMNLTLMFGLSFQDCQSIESSFVDQVTNFVKYAPVVLPEIPEYVLGPSKWFLFVRNNFDKLGKSTARKMVRNIWCQEYKFRHTLGQNELEMVIYFSESDLLASGGNALPIHIDFYQAGLNLVSISIYNVKEAQLENGHQGQGAMRSVEQIEEADEFLLRPEIFCDKILQNNNKIPTLRAHKEAFSFVNSQLSETQQEETRVMKISAAYHSRLGILQVERQHSQGDGARELLDLDNNRRYHVATQDGQAKGQCLETRIFPSPRNELDSSSILLGIQEAKYLGRARVRGIEALVYLAPKSNLPLWLEQPLVYHDANFSQMLTWDPTQENCKLAETFYRTVVYTRNSATFKLLKMEIWQMRRNRIVQKKQVISFFNFQWDVYNDAPKGDKYLHFLSLAKHCALEFKDSAQEAQNHHFYDTSQLGAQFLIELTKGQGNSVQDCHQLQELAHNERDLSLLASIKENYGLQVSMVRDFLVQPVEEFGTDSKDLCRFLVSFNLIEHDHKIVDLRRVGRVNYLAGPTKIYSASSLYRCFMHASDDVRQSVYFAFKATSGFCFVSRSKGEPLARFDEKNGKLELFQLMKKPDSAHDLEWFADSRQSLGEILQRQNSSLRVKYGSDNGELVFKVIRQYSHERTKILNDLDVQFVAGNKIEQVGLAGQDSPGSKLVSAETLVQCRSGCLVDLACQSYSFCTLATGAECILSNHSFASLTPQLNEAKLAGQRTFELPLDGGAGGMNASAEMISFKQRATCCLYDKNYLDYFQSSKSFVDVLHDFYLLRVDNAEQCAAYSVQLSLRRFQAFSRENRLSLDKLEHSIGEEFDESKAREGVQLIGKMRANAESIHSYLSNFVYIDSQQLQSSLKEEELKDMQSLASATWDQERQRDPLLGEVASELSFSFNDKTMSNPESENYCVFTAKPAESTKFKKLDIEAVRYDFKPLNFYEMTYGVGLRRSDFSEEQELALRRLRYSFKESQDPTQELTQKSKLTQDEVNHLLKIVEKFENNQLALRIDLKQCAQVCLSQSSGPWPSCKSFDFIVQRQNFSRRAVSYCLLNSITMEDAERNNRHDLIETFSSIERWHYEPRHQFDLNEISALEGQQIFLDSIPIYADDTSHHGKLLTFLLVIVGLANGFLIGIWFGRGFFQQDLKQHSDMVPLEPDPVIDNGNRNKIRPNLV